jgi:cytochrome c553
MSSTHHILSVALAAALSAIACVTPPEPADDPGTDPLPGDDDPGGDDPGGDDPDPTPVDPAVRALFDDTVAPVVSAKCAGCHGGPGTSPLKFVPPALGTMYDVVTSYGQLVGGFDTTSATLYARIVPGPHYGSVYTVDEAAAMTAWLDAERAARAGGGEPPPPVGEGPGQVSNRLIAEWSGCMELAAWDAEGVAAAWAELRSSEGPCIRCHVNGQASFIATDDSTRMFNVVSSNRYFLLSFFAADVADLAAAKMVINYDAFVRVATGAPPFNEHPQFDTENDAITALEAFYQKTLARQQAGACDPSRITP